MDLAQQNGVDQTLVSTVQCDGMMSAFAHVDVDEDSDGFVLIEMSLRTSEIGVIDQRHRALISASTLRAAPEELRISPYQRSSAADQAR